MLRKKIKEPLVRAYSTSRRHLAPEMESVYQQIFIRDMLRLGIEDEFYPLGWAANYGMMYLIGRICASCGVKNILELGAGQSSILLDRLAAAGAMAAAVTTVEHDQDWIDRLRPKLNHTLLHCPLKDMNDEVGAYRAYNFGPSLPTVVDLLIVDGPPAGTSAIANSRHGALQLIDRLDRTGFIVLIDDAEREGEVRLAQRFCASLGERGIAFRQGAAVAARKQIILAAGRLTEAAFF
jgi:hypothetical protein